MQTERTCGFDATCSVPSQDGRWLDASRKTHNVGSDATMPAPSQLPRRRDALRKTPIVGSDATDAVPSPQGLRLQSPKQIMNFRLCCHIFGSFPDSSSAALSKQNQHFRFLRRPFGSQPGRIRGLGVRKLCGISTFGCPFPFGNLKF